MRFQESQWGITYHHVINLVFSLKVPNTEQSSQNHLKSSFSSNPLFDTNSSGNPVNIYKNLTLLETRVLGLHFHKQHRALCQRSQTGPKSWPSWCSQVKWDRYVILAGKWSKSKITGLDWGVPALEIKLLKWTRPKSEWAGPNTSGLSIKSVSGNANRTLFQ